MDSMFSKRPDIPVEIATDARLVNGKVQSLMTYFEQWQKTLQQKDQVLTRIFNMNNDHTHKPSSKEPPKRYEPIKPLYIHPQQDQLMNKYRLPVSDLKESLMLRNENLMKEKQRELIQKENKLKEFQNIIKRQDPIYQKFQQTKFNPMRQHRSLDRFESSKNENYPFMPTFHENSNPTFNPLSNQEKDIMAQQQELKNLEKFLQIEKQNLLQKEEDLKQFEAHLEKQKNIIIEKENFLNNIQGQIINEEQLWNSKKERIQNEIQKIEIHLEQLKSEVSQQNEGQIAKYPYQEKDIQTLTIDLPKVLKNDLTQPFPYNQVNYLEDRFSPQSIQPINVNYERSQIPSFISTIAPSQIDQIKSGRQLEKDYTIDQSIRNYQSANVHHEYSGANHPQTSSSQKLSSSKAIQNRIKKSTQDLFDPTVSQVIDPNYSHRLQNSNNNSANANYFLYQNLAQPNLINNATDVFIPHSKQSSPEIHLNYPDKGDKGGAYRSNTPRVQPINITIDAKIPIKTESSPLPENQFSKISQIFNKSNMRASPVGSEFNNSKNQFQPFDFTHSTINNDQRSNHQMASRSQQPNVLAYNLTRQ